MKALGINGRKIEGRHILGKAGIKKKSKSGKKTPRFILKFKKKFEISQHLKNDWTAK